jgi:hypothetical protein
MGDLQINVDLLTFQMFFIKRLAILIFHLLSMSIAVYTRPEVGVSLLTGIKEDTDEIDSVEITR